MARRARYGLGAFANPVGPKSRFQLTRVIDGRTWSCWIGPNDMLTIPELAGVVGREPATIYAWIAQNKLRTRTRKGRLWVPFDEVKRVLAELGIGTGPGPETLGSLFEEIGPGVVNIKSPGSVQLIVSPISDGGGTERAKTDKATTARSSRRGRKDAR